MKTKSSIHGAFGTLGWCLSIITALVVGCENKYPPSLFDSEWKGNPPPEIVSILPPNSSFAGIGTITIVGKNFSPQKDHNQVYFNATAAEILAASETELRVRTPNFVGDSIRVKVSVIGSTLFSNVVLYRLETAVEEYSDIGNFDDVYAMDLDAQENLYVSLSPRKVDKITPDGVRQPYATLPFVRAGGMKVGPGGYLYLTRLSPALYRVPPGGGSAQLFATLPGHLYDLDFDEAGNLYAGGNGNNLYLVRPDGSNKIVADYPGVYIKAVRVFSGYVYVGGKAASGEEAVWRNQILPGEALGPKEKVFDWSGRISTTAGILSLTFAKDGDMYIGTDGADAILVVHPDGSSEPLYPGVLEPQSYALSWGNGQFLYANRRSDLPEKRRILRIKMRKEGAPYYGRR